MSILHWPVQRLVLSAAVMTLATPIKHEIVMSIGQKLMF